MHTEYFVLITDDYFGVFEVSARGYPDELKNNLNCVSVVKDDMLVNFLIEKLGRNILINKEFNIYNSIGQLYSRKPN